MASVFDVAAYVLAKQGPVSHMKLQKLAYYAQAWALVWNDRPLFGEPVQAWANGPVIPSLFGRLRGKFTVTAGDLAPVGNPDALTAEEREAVDRVLAFYGHRDSQWLSDLTHMEAPWRQARVGMAPDDRGDRAITHAEMAEYYGSL